MKQVDLSKAKSFGNIAEFERKALTRKIENIGAIPFSPETVMALKLLLRESAVDIPRLIKLIESDPLLMVAVLMIARRGSPDKFIGCAETAVGVMGLPALNTLANSVRSIDGFSPEHKNRLRHGYTCSQLMKALIEQNGLPVSGDMSLALLLHDIGTLLLEECSPKKHDMARLYAHKDRIPLFRTEETILNMNHAEAGAVLLRKWGFPEGIWKPISYHHLICNHAEDLPGDYILETALFQFVDWVDNRSRGWPCFEPTQRLMEAAGIVEIDSAYWLEFQSILISSADAESNAMVDISERLNETNDTSTVVLAKHSFSASPAAPQRENAFAKHKQELGVGDTNKKVFFKNTKQPRKALSKGEAEKIAEKKRVEVKKQIKAHKPTPKPSVPKIKLPENKDFNALKSSFAQSFKTKK